MNRDPAALRLAGGGSGLPLCVLTLFAFACFASVPCAQAQAQPNCGGSSTVADYDVAAVEPAEAFLAELQSAVKANNRSAVAGLIDFPLSVYSPPRRRRVFSKQRLLAQFPSVFTPRVKQAILAQRPACLFANYQGIMIGDGEVWFDKTARGRYAIRSMNVK